MRLALVGRMSGWLAEGLDEAVWELDTAKSNIARLLEERNL